LIDVNDEFEDHKNVLNGKLKDTDWSSLCGLFETRMCVARKALIRAFAAFLSAGLIHHHIVAILLEAFPAQMFYR